MSPSTQDPAASAAVAKPARKAAPARKTSPGPATLRAAPKAAPAAAVAKATPKPAPAVPAVALTPAVGKQKHKLVRDSFTIPKDEYNVLVGLKQRAGQLAHHARKSEILRAGVRLLTTLPDAKFLAALTAVPSLKTGRPKLDPAAPARGGKKS